MQVTDAPVSHHILNGTPLRDTCTSARPDSILLKGTSTLLPLNFTSVTEVVSSSPQTLFLAEGFWWLLHYVLNIIAIQIIDNEIFFMLKVFFKTVISIS